MAINIVEFDLKQSADPSKAKVVLAQISAPKPEEIIPSDLLDAKAKTKKAQIIEQQTALIKEQLERAMFENPNIILFPELSIPCEMQNHLKEFAVKEKIYIIGGLFYGSNFENACAVFTPTEGQQTPFQYKLNRAPKEDQRVKEGEQIIVFRNSGFGSFAAVICYDFTSLQIANNLRKNEVNIVFLPTYNPSIELFDKISKSASYTFYGYIALCNVSQYGNTAGYGPMRLYENSRLSTEGVLGMIAGTAKMLYPIYFDIPGLVTSIQNFRDQKEIPLGFITPPADVKTPNALLSPYTPLEPAKENFVGREEQQTQFRDAINQDRHLLLLGPSGTGKTSLIHKLKRSVALGVSAGFIEVFDNEKTFDFFRRLAHEISIQVQTSINDADFSDRLQRILDDVKRTQETIAQLEYKNAFKAFTQYFHELGSNFNTQLKGQKIVIFIDQAERFAWMEEEINNQGYAIKLLISIMKDFQRLSCPIYFALGVRQHDYDPLIALSNEQPPVAIISIKKFDNSEAEQAIKQPLPANISIEQNVVDSIVQISGGIPFFVQLLSDFLFRNLKSRTVIDKAVFEELGVLSQEDLYPLIMKNININEKKLIEVFAVERGYTISIETLISKLNMEKSEIRKIIDQLLSKNIIEELETNRFRFVHDRFKSYVQLEWLAKQQSNLDKLHVETETILHLLNTAPNDDIIASFNFPQTSITCYKAILLNEPGIIIWILENLLKTSFQRYAVLFVNLIRVLHGIGKDIIANELFFKMSPLLVKNNFFNELVQAASTSILDAFRIEKISIAIKFKIQEGEHELKAKNLIGAIQLFDKAVEWAKIIEDNNQIKAILEIALQHIIQESESNLKNDFSKIADAFETSSEWAKKIDDSKKYSFILNKIIKYRILEAEDYLREKNLDGASYIFANGAKWAKILGYTRQQKALLNKALKYLLKDLEINFMDEDYYSSDDDLKKVESWTMEMGDRQQQQTYLSKAINLKIKEAKQELKDKNLFSAAYAFADAAAWSKRIGDNRQHITLFRKAIKYRIRFVAQVFGNDNYNDKAEEILKIAEWNRTIGAVEEYELFWNDAIALKVKSIEKMLENEYFNEVSRNFVMVANWAKEIGNEQQHNNFLLKAIQHTLQEAEKNKVKENWHEAAIQYTNAAVWALNSNNEAYMNSCLEQSLVIVNKIKLEYTYFTKLLLTPELDECFNSIATLLEKKNVEQAGEYRNIAKIITGSRELIRSDKRGWN